MQVGFEMGLKFSNQCSKEVGARSKLSERYLEKAEFEWSVMGLGEHVEQAGVEMGSDVSNLYLKGAERGVMIPDPFDGQSKRSELWRLSSGVFETRWRLSERCLEKAEFEWSMTGLGKYVVQAGAEMGSDVSNQQLKEAARRVTISEPFDGQSKRSEL